MVSRSDKLSTLIRCAPFKHSGDLRACTFLIHSELAGGGADVEATGGTQRQESHPSEDLDSPSPVGGRIRHDPQIAGGNPD